MKKALQTWVTDYIYSQIEEDWFFDSAEPRDQNLVSVYRILWRTPQIFDWISQDSFPLQWNNLCKLCCLF